MATKQPELPAPEAAPKTKRVSDPELLAISACIRALEELTEAAQFRVIDFLSAKYDIRVVTPATKPLHTSYGTLPGPND